ncbi:hypothetical protein ACFQPA_02315 [Halomarina halobia]|uniref:Uncharacterized protein n=1 Tax=Halomarina halobia TaxID=3033386 RepID=A0ABD6A3Y5_9EURY|nr:hypothetical protein [Halomarina sp. PSR21]
MTANIESPTDENVPCADDWVDVRMTDPEAGEWDVDVVVLDGAVTYVDLRIRPSLLGSFVRCLLEDADAATAREVVEGLFEEFAREETEE